MKRSGKQKTKQRMIILIAMAGSGKRFSERGFLKAKFRLIANKKPIFDWALMSLKNFYSEADFVFACLPGHEQFIKERCRMLGIESYKIATFTNKTDGQASTVFLATMQLDPESPLLIYNIDTHIDPCMLHPEDIGPECDAWILLFKASGEHWSFAKIDSEGRVLEVTEKKRISSFASTGLYYFKSIAFFKQAYDSYGSIVKEAYKEIYIAPLYQHLLAVGHIITSKVIPATVVIPLGTPEEVLSFDPNFFNYYAIP